MICHIVQNGGYMFLILFLCIIDTSSAVKENILTVQEFCSGNLFMHNIEPGEPYVLTLKRENSSTGISKLYHKYKRKCRQEFKTSDSAGHFEIYITNMNIPSCHNCRCNYFEISAFGHSKRFCGSNEDFFSSKSDILFIDFHPGLSRQFEVTFTFTIKRNFYVITGIPNDASVPSNFIETPYFPMPYSPDYRAEYVLQSNNKDIHVMLLFLDFMVSHQSFIQVSGHNGSHSSRFYGNVFRPPVIVSQSNELSLKFESHDQRGMPGFSAEVWFIKSVDSLFVPYTDCGGPKDGSDGFVHIKTHEGFRLYDCMWHIMPFLMSTKSYLSVFVQLRHVGHKSYLEFRQGRYSKSDLVNDIIDCDIKNCSILDAETVVPASDFLYIRFRGYLEEYSVVNMSYNTYHIGNCSNKEFRCNDGRCLLSDFRCDGIKQCPDGVDEDSCPSTDVLEDEVPLYPDVHTKGFHSDAIDIKFFYVVLLGGIGVLIVIVAVFVFLYNHCKQTTVSGQSSQQAVGELSVVQTTLHSSNSCGCDNPPSYEDFIKSSYNYPPLLYTRANQSFIPNVNCTQCTTSFCTGSRVRHYSVDAFDIRSSDTDSDISFTVTGEDSQVTLPTSSNRCNIEINQNITFRKFRNIMKKGYSLDSKLNAVGDKDSCNFSFSIIHPVCTHILNHNSQVQYYTLPPNFKLNSLKTRSCNGQKVNRPACLQPNSSASFSKARRFTWSFVPHGSVGSEILTIVKTRCFSDPCRGISVHCSLY